MYNINPTVDFTNNLSHLKQAFGAANTQVSFSVDLDTSNNFADQKLSINGENMTLGQVAPADQTAANEVGAVPTVSVPQVG